MNSSGQEGSVLNVIIRNTWLKIVKKIMCNLCTETGHATALHVEKSMSDAKVGSQVKAVCTQVFENISKTSSSCTKTRLVNIYHVDDHKRVFRPYDITDEQKQSFLGHQWFLWR